MYTSATMLHVRVVLMAVGSMTCDMAAWLVDHGVAVMLTFNRNRLSGLAHVANREGGPSHQSFRNPLKRVLFDEIRIRVSTGEIGGRSFRTHV